VARRYATPVGVDLVALKGRRLAFVEVKRRKTADDAAWTVTAKQRRRIVRAAQYWLASHPAFAGHDIAFDVVLALALPARHRQRLPGLATLSSARPSSCPDLIRASMPLRLNDLKRQWNGLPGQARQ
jgi:Holliday junction resolvase-like predicted endonuclease